MLKTSKSNIILQQVTQYALKQLLYSILCSGIQLTWWGSIAKSWSFEYVYIYANDKAYLAINFDMLSTNSSSTWDTNMGTNQPTQPLSQTSV